MLPEFRPGLVYEFPDTSGMHDVLTYEMLQAYCESHPRPAAGLVRQPDDPGTTEPPAMRSAWQDDEAAADPRGTRWVLAWFFLIACHGTRRGRAMANVSRLLETAMSRGLVIIGAAVVSWAVIAGAFWAVACVISYFARAPL